MYPLQTKSILYFVAVCTTVLAGIFFTQQANADDHLWYYDADYTGWGGFFAWRGEYMGQSTRCADADMAEYSVNLKQYDSEADIPASDLDGIWVKPLANTPSGRVDGGWFYPAAGEEAYICVSPYSWVRFYVSSESQSSYVGSKSIGYRVLVPEERELERGEHFAFNVHLQPVGEVPTTEPVYPHLEAINVDPAYTFQLNHIPDLYDSGNADKYTYKVYDWGTNVLHSKFDVEIDGGTGQYTAPPVGLEDGYHTWFFTFNIEAERRLNGANYRRLIHTRYHDYWANFILDRVAPDSTVDISMTTDSGVTRSYVISNEAQDVTAGLADTTVFIENVDSGAVSTQTYAWPTVVNDYIGPRDPQSIDMTVTLDSDQEYRIYVETRDVAGNIVTSDSYDIDAVALPSLSGNGCTVAIGDSACDGVVSWSAGDNVFNATQSTFAYSTSAGTDEPISLEYGANEIRLRDSANSVLQSVVLSATCDASVSSWSAVQGMCVPLAPVVDVALLVDGVPQPTVPTVTPGQTVAVTWTSSPVATECRWVDDYGGSLSPISGPSGTANIDAASLDMSNVNELAIECRREVSGISSNWNQDSVFANVTALALELELDQSIIRSGEAVDVAWGVSGIDGTGFVFDCELIIPGATPITDTFTTDTIRTDSTGTTANMFNVVLLCTDTVSGQQFVESQRLEVIPTTQEI